MFNVQTRAFLCGDPSGRAAPSGRASQAQVKIRSLGQHREGGSILLGSISSKPEIELLSPIPALVPIRG